MKRTFPILTTLFLFAAAFARPCSGMSVVPPTFPQLVQRSESIVRARATAIDSRWDAAPQGQVIHTYIQFQVLRTLKGTATDTVTLRLLGGQVGATAMTIPDMPSFAVGSTYLLFIAGNGRAFCPLVGVTHGTYRVVTDAATGSQRVARANGEPLKSAADVVLPIEPISGSSPAVSSALKRDDFENAIIGEMSHASK